jgi:hypothetical protein
MARPLRSSERRFLCTVGATATATATAAALAVVLAVWTWSLTAGLPSSAAFIRALLRWFAAVSIWVVALVPTRDTDSASDLSAWAGDAWIR